MKKKILVSLGAVALLVSSLYASEGKSCAEEKNCGEKKCMKEKMNHSKCGSMKQKGMKHLGSHKKNPIAVIMQLDLTKEQREKIAEIRNEQKQSAPKISTAFSKDKFDKEAYMKMKKEHRETRLAREAAFIEKMYATLTPAQKEALKTELEK